MNRIKLTKAQLSALQCGNWDAALLRAWTEANWMELRFPDCDAGAIFEDLVHGANSEDEEAQRKTGWEATAARGAREALSNLSEKVLRTIGDQGK